MNYKQELNKSLQKLRDIEFALNESAIVAITNSQGVIQFANDKFCKVSKYTKEELIGSKQSIVNSGYHSKEFFKKMWRTIGNGNVWRGEIKNKAKDGTFYWVDTTIVPFINKQGKPYQYIAIRHDITKRKEYEEKIEMMAFFDPLTSLPNRNYLNKWLKLRSDNYATVLFLDLDRFKSINDNYGHQVGDMILKEVARRIKTTIRYSDFVTRQGGDEFIILLYGYQSREEITNTVIKLNQKLSSPYYIKNEAISTSVSIGISMNPKIEIQEDNTDLVEKLIRQADTAMYHAKKLGGNTYCYNTPKQNKQMNQYYEIEKELIHALYNDEFYLVYQPLVRIHDERITGVEVLLRWKNPILGEVSPNLFIPLLESIGMIIPVGNWIIQCAARQMKKWQNEGIYLDRISINVSPIQFSSNQFVKTVKNILREINLDPHLIELEITEGTILDINKSKKIMHDLKALGIRISIDDFGTGYSSLQYLKQLPIDTLKIDRTFIQDITAEDEVIVNTIISMAKNLNFNIVAEGIENKLQLEYLREQNCHEGQGYYWSKPVSPEEISKNVLVY